MLDTVNIILNDDFLTDNVAKIDQILKVGGSGNKIPFLNAAC